MLERLVILESWLTSGPGKGTVQVRFKIGDRRINGHLHMSRVEFEQFKHYFNPEKEVFRIDRSDLPKKGILTAARSVVHERPTKRNPKRQTVAELREELRPEYAEHSPEDLELLRSIVGDHKLKRSVQDRELTWRDELALAGLDDDDDY